AKRHLESGSDSGVLRLIEAIEARVDSSTEIQESATSAKQREARDRAREATSTLQKRVMGDLKWSSAQLELILHQKERLEERAQQSCKLELIAVLREFIEPKIDSPMSEEELASFSEEILKEVGEQIEKASAAIRRIVCRDVRVVWDELIHDRTSSLEQQIASLMRDKTADKKTLEFLNDELAAIQSRRTALRRSMDAAVDDDSLLLGPIITVTGWVASYFTDSRAPGVASMIINFVRDFAAKDVRVSQFSREMCIRAISEGTATKLVSEAQDEITNFIGSVADDATDRLCRERFGGRRVSDLLNIQSLLTKIEADLSP
ncbi:MAG: hypothetical protein AAF585_20250, partial [Verrucomicrobiota bacterium]